MRNGWTVGKKLLVSFLGVTAITLMVGGLGYYGAAVTGQAVDKLGNNSVPKVQSTLTISDRANEIKACIRTLLNPDLPAADRKRQPETIAKATQAWRDAWQVYEQLPQTVEEANTWKEFVPAWAQLEKDNAEFLRLNSDWESLGKVYTEKGKSAGVTYNRALTEVDNLVNATQIKFKSQIQEWKNILLRGNDSAKYDKHFAAFEKEEKAVQSIMAQLVDLMAQLGIDTKSAEDAAQKHAAMGVQYRAALKKYDRTNPQAGQEVDKAVTGIDRPCSTALEATTAGVSECVKKSRDVQDQLNHQGMVVCRASLSKAQGLLNKIVEMNQSGAAGATRTSLAQARLVKTISIAAMIAGVVLALGLGFVISRSITKSITRIASHLSAGSQQTSSAAGQVSSSSQSLAQGASEQAAALEETTSALEEMASMTKKNAETAQQAALLSAESQQAATKGNEAMSRMSGAIHDIQKSASETAKIVKVIDEIAFQTNLLALNAAVEAARAGEAGKGFAVVAEEVRNLAMRSAEAARNTAALIEESVNNAKNGVTIAVEVGKNLEEITTSNTKVNNLVSEIAAASREQSQGIGQVNTAVAQMDKVTQSNAASAEESAAAAEELSSQAEQVSSMVRELTAMVMGASTATAARGVPARISTRRAALEEATPD